MPSFVGVETNSLAYELDALLLPFGLNLVVVPFGHHGSDLFEIVQLLLQSGHQGLGVREVVGADALQLADDDLVADAGGAVFLRALRQVEERRQVRQDCRDDGDGVATPATFGATPTLDAGAR